MMVAVKKVKQSTSLKKQQYIGNEFETLKKLAHPNIVKLIDLYHDNSHFYYITELCPGNNLLEDIMKGKKFSEPDLKIIIKQLFQAINYCHLHQICHRDIKPDNIVLVNNNEVKLIDFGTACKCNEEMTEARGTLMYMAPELLEKKRYDEKCDIWAIGIVMYTMITGVFPYREPKKLLKEQIVGRAIDWEALNNAKDVSSQCIEFILQLL
jgi:calcium-dependent protein kinase